MTETISLILYIVKLLLCAYMMVYSCIAKKDSAEDRLNSLIYWSIFGFLTIVEYLADKYILCFGWFKIIFILYIIFFKSYKLQIFFKKIYQLKF